MNYLTHFSFALMKWHTKNARNFPWIKEKDPYRVWLSEIILQQTRVEQGLPYYQKFIRRYPTVCDLANAGEKEVFRLWQGLGYYNRCKNMLTTAGIICHKRGGQFPVSFHDLLTLPGIGPYTAAAIASFAFGLPHAVVDGNVERVLARYFGIHKAVNGTEGKKYFNALANKLLLKEDPASFNQAMMDFGSVVCMPRQPLCHSCPLSATCKAFKKGEVHLLPLKQPKRKPVNRYIHYYVICHDNCLYIRKRTAKDIWQNLHEFIIYENNTLLSENELRKTGLFSSLIANNTATVVRLSETVKHQLSHQTLYIRFLMMQLQKPPVLPDEHYFGIASDQVDEYAFPRVITRYLQKEGWIK